MEKENENMPPAAHRLQAGPAPQAKTAVLAELIALARRLGASDAAIVEADAIRVDEGLARFCLPPGCPHYGRSAGCPPYVNGPHWFRAQLKHYRWAVLVRIDANTEVLRSDRSKSLFRQLHRIAAGIERSALSSGCPDAMAFAGGSCRFLFCGDQTGCPVMEENGVCRHPKAARPSLSGYGVDVGHLAGLAGWQMRWVSEQDASDGSGKASVYALVLVV